MNRLTAILFFMVAIWGCTDDVKDGSANWDTGISDTGVTGELSTSYTDTVTTDTGALVDSATNSAIQADSDSGSETATATTQLIDTQTEMSTANIADTVSSDSDTGTIIGTSSDADSSDLDTATSTSMVTDTSTVTTETDSSADTTPVLSPLGSACGASETCASSHCVDGVCCESACADVCMACGADGRCDVVPEVDTDCPAFTCPSSGNECLANITAQCAELGVCATTADCTFGFVPISFAQTCDGSDNRICDGTGGCMAAPACGEVGEYCLTGNCCIDGNNMAETCGECAVHENILSLQCSASADCETGKYCVFDASLTEGYPFTSCVDDRFSGDANKMATCTADDDCDVSERCEASDILWSNRLPRLCAPPVVDCGGTPCNTGFCCIDRGESADTDDDVAVCGDTDFECPENTARSIELACRTHRDCPQGRYCNIHNAVGNSPDWTICEDERGDEADHKTVCEYDSDCTDDTDSESCLLDTAGDYNFIIPGTCKLLP